VVQRRQLVAACPVFDNSELEGFAMAEYIKHDSRAIVAELIKRLREIDPDTLTELVYTIRNDAPDGGFRNQFQKDPFSDRARPPRPV
jgi:hypothetical protein